MEGGERKPGNLPVNLLPIQPKVQKVTIDSTDFQHDVKKAYFFVDTIIFCWSINHLVPPLNAIFSNSEK